MTKPIIKNTLENTYPYTKRLGQRHYSIVGQSETLCGCPMLGNNYANDIPENEQTDCKACLEHMFDKQVFKLKHLKKMTKPIK